jgi:hypothetical protein
MRCPGEVVALCADVEVAESVECCSLGRDSRARGRCGRLHAGVGTHHGVIEAMVRW